MFHVNYGDKELTEVTIFYGMNLPLKVYLTYLCHLVFNMVRYYCFKPDRYFAWASRGSIAAFTLEMGISS